jgi:hypothetical protein
MQRCQFRAQCREGVDIEGYFREALPGLKERMKEAEAWRLSLFSWNNQLFLYYESRHEGSDPHFLFGQAQEVLEMWPGGDSPRYWAPMMDIFHYQAPVSEEHWKRKEPAGRPYARIARLHPEQVSSYIFYHYQYQEEKPGDGDKYGVIALHENLMLFYAERPSTIETPPYTGKLSTAHTPTDWGSVMQPHFMMWEGETGNSRIWLELPLVLEA